jgi:Uma2 family endonuclease
MPLAYEFWTVQDVYDLPDDGNRYETVGGELLVTPAPTLVHQVVSMRLTMALGRYLETCPVGMLFASPAEATRDDVTRVQPDVMVVPSRWFDAKKYGAIRELMFVAEVLSPSSRRFDRFTKRAEYQRQGVPVYWVIDPIGLTAEEWVPDAATPRMLPDALRWHPAGASKPFEMPLAALFAGL